MVAEATGALHPGQYARGLAAAARRAGAVLADGARVRGIARDGAGFVLSTDRGVVRADRVLVATNGYSWRPDGAALPWLARRLVPVASYIIATEPIGAERVRALFPPCA